MAYHLEDCHPRVVSVEGCSGVLSRKRENCEPAPAHPSRASGKLARDKATAGVKPPAVDAERRALNVDQDYQAELNSTLLVDMID